MASLQVDGPHAEETEHVAPAVEEKSTDKSKDFDLSESEEEKNEPMEENIELNEEKLEDKPAGLGNETEFFAEFPEDDDSKEKDNVDLHVEDDDDDDD